MFPLQKLPEESSELARRMRQDAVARVSAMEAQLELQQARLLRESKRRVRVTRVEAKAEVEELTKVRWWWWRCGGKI